MSQDDYVRERFVTMQAEQFVTDLLKHRAKHELVSQAFRLKLQSMCSALLLETWSAAEQYVSTYSQRAAEHKQLELHL